MTVIGTDPGRNYQIFVLATKTFSCLDSPRTQRRVPGFTRLDQILDLQVNLANSVVCNRPVLLLVVFETLKSFF